MLYDDEKYEKLESKILNEIISNYNYEEAICLCEKYIRILKKDKIISNENYRFGYYNMALSYKKMNNFNNAITYAVKSIKYMKKGGYDESDYRFINSTMLLANCYEKLGIKDIAIDYYNNCSELYERIKMYNYQIASLFSIANINKDTEQMKKLIAWYKEALNHDSFEVCKDKEQKINTLKEMEDVLASCM